MNYGFDVKKMATMLLPSFLRKSKQIAWIVALLAPFERLRREWLSFIDQTRYNASLTGQVIILQMHLNNRFDFSTRLIRIIDGNPLGTFIWFQDENQAPNHTRFKNESNEYTMYLRFKDEFVQTFDFDFIVRVPSEYENIELAIRAVIEAYKLAGKRYKIIYI
jgi:hypothetical protein